MQLQQGPSVLKSLRVRSQSSPPMIVLLRRTLFLYLLLLSITVFGNPSPSRSRKSRRSRNAYFRAAARTDSGVPMIRVQIQYLELEGKVPKFDSRKWNSKVPIMLDDLPRLYGVKNHRLVIKKLYDKFYIKILDEMKEMKDAGEEDEHGRMSYLLDARERVEHDILAIIDACEEAGMNLRNPIPEA
jgi:hypothetical protein